MPPDREIDIEEHPEVPWLSVVLGYGPMLPIVAAAIGAWVGDGVLRDEAILLGVLYSASILAFLGGVRRGLSFRTAGGPAVAQILTMGSLWLAAFAALILVVHGLAVPALVLLVFGFVAIMILDPIAARNGQAPLFFARLRPTQTPIAVAGLLALLGSVLIH